MDIDIQVKLGNVEIILLSEDSRISDSDGIIEFYVNQESKDYQKIKKLCKYNTPFNVVFMWESYKNINYGIILESFIMENTSKDIGEFSNFYGKSESYNRLNNRKYLAILRKYKIEKILSKEK